MTEHGLSMRKAKSREWNIWYFTGARTFFRRCWRFVLRRTSWFGHVVFLATTMDSHVIGQRSRMREASAAHLALVRLLAGMQNFVVLKHLLQSERLVALITCKGTFTSVDSFMSCESTSLTKSFTTHVALKWLLASMHSHVDANF